MEKKMTKREKFEMLAKIAEVKANPILTEFIEHELELLAKKNASGNGKLTATQKENEVIKEEIVKSLEVNPDRLYTITEMLKEFECCKPYTNQKISALLKQLIADGKVEKVEEKRKSYFKLA